MANPTDSLDPLFVPVRRENGEQERISRPALSAFQDSWRRLRQNKAAVISLILLGIMIVLAIVGPWLTKYSYAQTNYSAVYQSPSADHWFGTDKFGRDQWARIWQGTRISLLIAVLAAALDLVVGVAYGAISALKGGKVDNVMQRIIEILIGVPSLIIIILLMMIMKANIFTIMVAMSITGWVGMARLVRAQILKLKQQEFVLAARTLGTSNTQIIFKHLIPNTIGMIVINTMFTIPSAIFTEAFLSFIGLGLQSPQASLGVLIHDGFQTLSSHFYLLLFPALVIVVIMVAFNILGDGLRDALDPRMRK
ncbi:ABC transporter permease [Cohnella thailandensis]|uniref:ABC transporter permease n=1 Tax=Cohnella thailandensis TaxID=557557 RepID=A0A841SSF5_9BACL|nr:ABC transporter permease [Cohnella thailandensis]MBB6633909.1 ABC transporter permease [Cohnella thailandensis]MBP1972592.1 oligopeptide transport system permease protein [Cohnella thailandensis]